MAFVGPGGIMPEELSVQQQIASPKEDSSAPFFTGADIKSLLGLGVQFGLNQWSAAIHRRWQERMMDKQRQWQLEDWNRQNNYNSPASVMARMRSAGLNPDLLVGGNNSDASVPAQASAPAGSQGHPVDMSSMTASVMAMLNARQVESEIKLNEANARNLISEANERDSLRPYHAAEIQSKIDFDRATIDIQRKLASSHIHLEDEQIKLIMEEQAKTLQETNYQTIINKHAEDRIKAEINNLKASKRLTDAQAKEILNTIDELKATWGSRKTVILNSAKKSSSDATSAWADAEQQLLDVLIRKGAKEADIEYIMNFFSGSNNGSTAEGVVRRLIDIGQRSKPGFTGMLYPGAAK